MKTLKTKARFWSEARLQVLIADDPEIVRRGVRSILESRQDLEICGEASNGRDAVLKASQLRPDLVILDHSMPILSGLAATGEIPSTHAKGSDTLVLSMHNGKALLDALREWLERMDLSLKPRALTSCLKP